MWITSTNVLQTILNSAIEGRSRYKLEEIIEESNRYVVTRSHNQAMKMLEDKHSIIITGEPGVGKTSLADQLCQNYVAHGFDLCFIENSLNEAEAYYNEERKQIFYFDDFLGRNFLLALSHHQDSQVINFISRIKRDKKKRFILTSRTNVLNKGKHLSDLFEIKKVDRNEYEVTISALTDYDKAKILYNHIWFSQLDDGYIDEIYKKKRYHKIIKHNNYNPRLISFITDAHRLESIELEDYWSYIEDTLGNPRDIWKNVFDVQIDEISKHMVVAVSINGIGISEQHLKEFYSRLKAGKLCVGDTSTFYSVMRLLVGALLNRTVVDKDYILYNLFNPSIADYVLSSYMDDIDYVDELLACLKTIQAIDNINSLCKSGELEHRYCSKLVDMQLDRVSKSSDKYTIDGFLLRLLVLASELLSPNDVLLKYISSLTDRILTNKYDVFDYRVLKFIKWSMNLGVVKKNDSRIPKAINYWISEEDIDHEEFKPLSELIIQVEPKGGELTSRFKNQYIEYLSERITSETIDEGILSDTFDHDSYPYNELTDFVSERLSDVAVDFESEDITEISECCDIDEVIQANIDASVEAEEEYEMLRDSEYETYTSNREIDDLFDRG